MFDLAHMEVRNNADAQLMKPFGRYKVCAVYIRYEIWILEVCEM